MKYVIVFISLVSTLACAPLKETAPPSRISGDILSQTKLDVGLFLSTSDPIVEAQVLNRLKRLQVPVETVKTILLDIAKVQGGPVGMLHGLEIEADGEKYPYALFVPESAKPGDALPLVVVLHGMGGTGDSILEPWVKRLSREFIVLCPTYPMGAWWAQRAEDLVLKLVQTVQSAYPVDLNRVFLVGVSNGAIGAYMIGMFNPDLFAGIVPIASGITPRYMHFLVNLKNTPIYIIQGVYDPIFPIQLSRRVHKILTDMKYPVVYREHDKTGTAHGGHFLPKEEVGPLVEWIKKQKRDPLPRVVRMTREANHLGRINWVRLAKGVQMAALQIPGPEKERTRIRDGKIATLFAFRTDPNEFTVMGNNMLEFEIFLNSGMIDFNQPVRITTQNLREEKTKMVPEEKQLRFNHKVKKDLNVLLRSFKTSRDPNLLFDAKVTISMEKTFAFLAQP
ncbi:MAG: hypothetical protein ACE5E9_01820 [Nitrospinaceae bacterium]